MQQDYTSTQRGLKAAVAAGVVEIESHGWTHMQPDLESPPGPWWTADLAGEGSADGWYTEFEDHRRGMESPAIVQLFHMERSLEYLQEDFGQRALELRPGGSGWSKSQFNHTGRIAAQAGFGLFHAEPDFYYYLDKDRVLDMSGIAPQVGTTSYDRLADLHPERWPLHPDGPAMLLFHDRDIALQPDFVERLFAALPPAYQTLSLNEYRDSSCSNRFLGGRQLATHLQLRPVLLSLFRNTPFFVAFVALGVLRRKAEQFAGGADFRRQ